jgi:hypothetical protein
MTLRHNQRVEPMGASHPTQSQFERHRRLAPLLSASLGCNLSCYMVLKHLVDIRLRSQLATPRSQLAALTLAAFAAAWFCALVSRSI